MSLRLLCETAAQEENIGLDDYIKKYFSQGKTNLDKDFRTFISQQNVKDKTIIQLLQSAAHNYPHANTKDQTVALSIIVGQIIQISHKN